MISRLARQQRRSREGRASVKRDCAEPGIQAWDFSICLLCACFYFRCALELERAVLAGFITKRKDQMSTKKKHQQGCTIRETLRKCCVILKDLLRDTSFDNYPCFGLVCALNKYTLTWINVTLTFTIASKPFIHHCVPLCWRLSIFIH